MGSAAEPQPELGKALDSLRPQDVLLVTGLDRLAGDLGELIARMVQVQAKGASVRTLPQQGSIEAGAANAKELLDALLAFEGQRAKARKQQKTNTPQEPSEQLERPRLLDDAATRLVASRAHPPESARATGGSARPVRRTDSHIDAKRRRS